MLANVYQGIGTAKYDFNKVTTSFCWDNIGNSDIMQSVIQINLDNKSISKRSLSLEESKETEEPINSSFFQLSKHFSVSAKVNEIRVVLQKTKSDITLEPKIKLPIINKVKIKEPEKTDCVDQSVVNGFVFTVQKNYFIELDLNFTEEDMVIESVSGLPKNLLFQDGKIKGTPMEAGEFPFTILLNNGIELDCKILVPNLVRLM